MVRSCRRKRSWFIHEPPFDRLGPYSSGLNRYLSSPGKRGPITTTVRSFHRSCPIALSRRMDPRFAGTTVRNTSRVKSNQKRHRPPWMCRLLRSLGRVGLSRKADLGPLEAEMVAQHRAGILRPEQTAPLQFRHDQIDEIGERAW